MRDFAAVVWRLTIVLLACYFTGAARWAQGRSFVSGVKERFGEEERKVRRELRKVRLQRREVSA